MPEGYDSEFPSTPGGTRRISGGICCNTVAHSLRRRPRAGLGAPACSGRERCAALVKERLALVEASVDAPTLPQSLIARYKLAAAEAGGDHTAATRRSRSGHVASATVALAAAAVITADAAVAAVVTADTTAAVAAAVAAVISAEPTAAVAAQSFV